MRKLLTICFAGSLLIVANNVIAEPSLTEILNTIYGVGNYTQYMGADELWINMGGNAKGQALFGPLWVHFGYFPGSSGGVFTNLFTIAPEEYWQGYLNGEPSSTFSIAETGNIFRFAEQSYTLPIWSSRISQNIDGMDHMATFVITDGPSAGNYVLGWEDLTGLGDLDYQDLVIEVSGVVPIVGPVIVDVDIKPDSCPNPLNVKNKGLLPVCILGTEDFDVTTIDIASIRLAGVAPVRSSYEDVSTTVPDGAELCECTTEGPDGQLDLTLKFNAQDIVLALGEVNDGDLIELTLTGVLAEAFGETPIEGTDCVVIIAK